MKKTDGIPFIKMLIFCVILNGCTNDVETIIMDIPIDYTDSCEAIASLGEYELNQNTEKFIPYPDSISRIIFTDSTGQEFAGIVTDYSFSSNATVVSGYTSPCPVDTSIDIRYSYKPVDKNFRFEIREFDIRVSVHLIPSLTPLSSENRSISDMCYIFLTPFGTVTNSSMKIVVDPRTNPMPRDDYSFYKTQYEVGGTLYEDVYINSIDDEDDYEILYNDQFGILGIRKTTTPMVYLVYDRIEF